MMGSTHNTIYMPEIAALRFALPPPREQQNIVEYLANTTNQLDKLIAEAGKLISLLTERRAALISAAVTGKIVVRPVVDRSKVRFLVGASIMEAIAHKPNFGRTKFHKFVYLTEVHVGVHELQGNYLREAAGPLDRAMLKEMEAALEQAGHTVARQVAGRGSLVTYEVVGQRGSVRTQLETILGPRMAAFEELLDELGDEKTRSVEAVATLYAAWNDSLLDGDRPSSDDIVFEVLNNWHPQKGKKFKAPELHTWLRWMRRRRVVPSGSGPKTTTGRLFP